MIVAGRINHLLKQRGSITNRGSPNIPLFNVFRPFLFHLLLLFWLHWMLSSLSLLHWRVSMLPLLQHMLSSVAVDKSCICLIFWVLGARLLENLDVMKMRKVRALKLYKEEQMTVLTKTYNVDTYICTVPNTWKYSSLLVSCFFVCSCWVFLTVVISRRNQTSASS